MTTIAKLPQAVGAQVRTKGRYASETFRRQKDAKEWTIEIAGLVKAYAKGCKNALLTDDGSGNVVEGPGFNVFMVSGGRVKTPARGILEGMTRHVWAEARERADAHRLTGWGKRLYKRCKETVELSFADAKQLFGHRYARFRGLAAVLTQCLLAAAAQNMKKIALALTAMTPQIA